MSQILELFSDWIEFFLIHQPILYSILLLTIEEMGIPIPVPGDVVIAFLGYEVSKGEITYPIAFIILMIAVLIGSSVLYYLSYHFGQIIILKLGKFLHLSEKRLLQVEEKFRKYGFLVIIFGRHIPGFRIPITVFAGMSKISYKTFILSTFVSIIAWIPIYLYVGIKLGKRTLNMIHFSSWHITYLLPFIFIAILAVVFIKIRLAKKN